MFVGALCSCSSLSDRRALDRAITLTSSDARANAEWLDGRLDVIPNPVVIGTAADNYGVDTSKLEEDGYILRTVEGQTLIFARTATGLDMAVRKYAKAVEAGDWAHLDEVYHEGVRIEKLTIAGNDISTYSITVEGEWEYLRTWITNNVAQSLSSLIAYACGVTVPVNADGEHKIILRQLSDESLDESDYFYEVGDDGEVVIGYTERVGAKYGMLMFLQDQLGWQDISFGDDYLPEADEIDIPAGTASTVHAMFGYGLFPYNSYDPPADAYYNTLRNRVNGSLYNLWYKKTNAGHGLLSYKWANPSIPYYYQICYTDEANFEAAFNNILNYIEDRIDGGSVIGNDLTCIDISQGDCFGYCQCKNCMKVLSKENGANSGPVVRWANRLAAAIEDEGYGGLAYLIFAYHGSNTPCVTKCRSDVYVTFCTDGHCSRHFLDGSQCQWVSFDMVGSLGPSLTKLNNNHYAEWIRGWGEICENLYVWFYALDNNVHQYTIIEQMFEDFKLLSSYGVKAIFWQIPYHGLGIVKVEQQLGMLMNLHPDMTKEEYRDELVRLIQKTYGDGWAEILEYLDLWEEAEIAKQDCSNCWSYGGPRDYGNTDPTTYLANWERMIELLESAIPKANSARQQAACELLSVSMYYIGCYYSYFPAYMENDTERLALLEERYDLLIKRLKDNGYNPAAIVGVDNGTCRIHENINVMAWNDWIDDFNNFFPDVDVSTVTFPEEWIFVEEPGT